MQSGIVFNIQKFSTHDGPGIRTTVFFKGCPLSCWWCHNPESKQAKPLILFTNDKCLGCGMCVKTCPNKAISLSSGTPSIDAGLCTLCGRCHLRCPSEALQLSGKRMSVDEVMHEIEKDKVFYAESGGGVTFSGGEPLMQLEFLLELLRRCKSLRIHTAIDTAGHVHWQALEQVSKWADLFLYDLKHMDNGLHEKYTGVPNTLVLENLKRLARLHKQITLRVPVIPGINDDESNLLQIANLATSLNLNQLHLLPYHSIGSGKYELIGEEYRLMELMAPSGERMAELAASLRGLGLTVTIGGVEL